MTIEYFLRSLYNSLHMEEDFSIRRRLRCGMNNLSREEQIEAVWVLSDIAVSVLRAEIEAGRSCTRKTLARAMACAIFVPTSDARLGIDVGIRYGKIKELGELELERDQNLIPVDCAV